MTPLHPFWKLPLELRLIIYELCDIRALAKFARAYASSNATAYREEIEQRFYSRHLIIGNHAALSRAIKVSRHHPTAACGTVAKLHAYGQFDIGSETTSAFQRDLNGFISTHKDDHTFEEALLVTAARQGHPSLFRMLFEARFLAATSPNEDQRPKEVTLEGTQSIQHQHWRLNSVAPGLTTQKPDVTALGYAFRRSLSKKYYDGPEMLCTVLDCVRLLSQQLAEEGESLQARAMNGSISLDEASELSIDLGLRSQTVYRMGHLLTIGDADVIVPFHAPGCVSVLTALAWFGDPIELLPGQLRDYQAIVDCWCIEGHEAFTPLLGAIDSASKREFDLIMDQGDVDLDLSRSNNMLLDLPVFNNRRLSTPILMAISGCTRLRDISRGRPGRTVYATRVEMLEALLQHGADPNLPSRRGFHELPLSALVGQIFSAVREIGTDAFMFAYQATEALLNAGADPLKETPYGLCPLHALLRSMHNSRLREVPSLYSRRRTRAMFEGELAVRVLGRTIQQFFEHRPDLLTATIPGIDCSAVGFAVAEGNNQLADYLHSLGAS